MKRNRHILLSTLLTAAAVLGSLAAGSLVGVKAQSKVVEGVKKDLNGLSLSAKGYKSALDKLKPALVNEETKVKAETWMLAGKICFGYYDRSMVEKSIGSDIDKKTVGKMLISGYDYFAQALKLDSVKQTRKDGSVITDRNGQPRVRTRYSAGIKKRVLEHLIDFSAVGGDLLMASDWDGAYRAWEIYCTEAQSDYANRHHKQEADSIVGYYRYYQGLAAFQGKKYADAAMQFERARGLGYVKKDLYDSWIASALQLADTAKVQQVALEANEAYGASDPQYTHILINCYLNEKNYTAATSLLDNAIKRDSANAECLDLKGQLVERLEGAGKAMPYYRRAVELQPDFARALFDLGNCLYMQAVRISDRRSEAATALYRESLPYVEKAYKLDPKNTDARKVLSRLYYVLGSNKLDEIEK